MRGKNPDEQREARRGCKEQGRRTKNVEWIATKCSSKGWSTHERLLPGQTTWFYWILIRRNIFRFILSAFAAERKACGRQFHQQTRRFGSGRCVKQFMSSQNFFSRYLSQADVVVYAVISKPKPVMRFVNRHAARVCMSFRAHEKCVPVPLFKDAGRRRITRLLPYLYIQNVKKCVVSKSLLPNYLVSRWCWRRKEDKYALFLEQIKQPLDHLIDLTLKKGVQLALLARHSLSLIFLIPVQESHVYFCWCLIRGNICVAHSLDLLCVRSGRERNRCYNRRLLRGCYFESYKEHSKLLVAIVFCWISVWTEAGDGWDDQEMDRERKRVEWGVRTCRSCSKRRSSAGSQLVSRSSFSFPFLVLFALFSSSSTRSARFSPYHHSLDFACKHEHLQIWPPSLISPCAMKITFSGKWNQRQDHADCGADEMKFDPIHWQRKCRNSHNQSEHWRTTPAANKEVEDNWTEDHEREADERVLPRLFAKVRQLRI